MSKRRSTHDDHVFIREYAHNDDEQLLGRGEVTNIWRVAMPPLSWAKVTMCFGLANLLLGLMNLIPAPPFFDGYPLRLLTCTGQHTPPNSWWYFVPAVIFGVLMVSVQLLLASRSAVRRREAAKKAPPA